MGREWEERGYPSTEPHRTVLSFLFECIAVAIGLSWIAFTSWSAIQRTMSIIAGWVSR